MTGSDGGDDGAKVNCGKCGARQDASREACGACGAEFRRMCKCGATVSLFEARCPNCSAQVRRPRKARRSVPWKKIGLALGLSGVAALGAFAWVHRPATNASWRLRGEGIDHFAAARYEQAAKTFEAITQENPRDAHAWYMLAASYKNLGMSAEAWAPAAKKCLEFDPAFAEASLLLASAAHEKGRLGEAITYAAAAADSPRATAGTFELLVDLLLSEPEPDAARVRAALEEARRRRFDTPMVRLTLADVRLRVYEALPRESYPVELASALRDAAAVEDESVRGRFDPIELAVLKARIDISLGAEDDAWRRLERARADVTTATPAPTRARLGIVYGWLLWKRGGKPAARIAFDEALELDPSAAAAGDLCTRLAAIGETAEAVDVLRAASERPDAPPAMKTAYAAALLASGRDAAAGAAIDALLATAPDDPNLLEMLADVRLGERRFDDARAALDRAAKAAPGRTGVAIKRAILSVQAAPDAASARTAGFAALEELRGLERAAGPRAEISLALGMVYLDLEDPGAAVGELTRATAAAPSVPRAWTLLAHALASLGRAEEAVRAFGRARALLPDDPVVVLGEARARLGSGDPSSAVVGTSTYLARHAGEPAVLRVRAEAFGQLGKWNLAADDLAAAATAGPADESLHLALVDASFRAGRTDAARAAVTAALAGLTGEAADRVRFLSELHEHGAVAALRMARETGASTFAAEIQLAAGDAAAAAATARELLARDPKDAAAARVLVHALLRTDAPAPEALREARAAVDALPPTVDAALRAGMLGVVLLAEGDVAGATKQLANAADVRRDDPLVLFFHGEALLRAGEGDRGLASMRRAVASPQAFGGMREALCRRLALASELTDDLARAEDLAAEAHRLDPSFARAAFRLVALLISRGEPRGAADVASRTLPLVAPGSPEAVRLRDEAVSAWLGAGEAPRARALLEGGDAAYLGRPAAKLIGAFIDLRTKRAAEAERAFTEIATSRTEPLAVTGLVLCALAKNDPAAAVGAVADWTAAHGNDRDVRLSSARMLLAAGHVDEAIALTAACRDAHPADRRSAAELVRALAQAGRTAEALAAAERFAPGDTPAARAESRLFAAVTRLTCGGDPTDALAAARQVAGAAGTPRTVVREAEVLEVEALLGLGRDDEASARLDAFLAPWTDGRPPTTADAVLEARVRFAKGTLEAGRGRYAPATEAFERCLAIDGNDFAAANNLSWVLIQTPATIERGRAIARRVTEARPQDPNFWDTRAQGAAKVRDLADAASSWTRAIELHGAAWGPSKAGVALRFARHLRSCGKAEEASSLAQQVIDARLGPAYDAAAREVLAH